MAGARSARKRPAWRIADLGALAQIMVRDHASEHGFPDRHRANADTGVVTALGRDLALRAETIDRAAGREDGRRGLHGKARDDRLSGRDAAENAAGMIGKKGDAFIAGPHLVGVLLTR